MSFKQNYGMSVSFAVALILLVVVVHQGPVSGASVLSHPLSKRSFFDIQCKGVFDKSIFARLNRVCEDCYHIYRDAELHNLCRSNCFESIYFKGCVKVLLDEEEKYQEMIQILGGK